MKTLKKIQFINWKKYTSECGFHAMAKTGETFFVEDAPAVLRFKINNNITDETLFIKVHEYMEDYQKDENTTQEKQFDYSHIEKCTIEGNKDSISNLCYSLGWSNLDNFHFYKTPLIEELERQFDNLKWSIDELMRKLDK